MANDRFARTRTEIVTKTDGPTVRSQPVAHPVAQVRPSTDGLEAVDRAFAHFFGQFQTAGEQLARTAEMVEQHEHRRDLALDAEVNRQQGDQRQTRAVSDAEAGRPMDPTLAQHFDYATTYRRQTGTRNGQRLYQDWLDRVVRNAGPDTDLNAATEQWLRQEWGNGTGDQTHDAYALATFRNMATRAITQHRENAIKAQVERGVQTIDANLATDVAEGRVSVESYNRAVSERAALDPMHAHEAPIRVLNSILAATPGNPQSINRVLTLLDAPGAMSDGRSIRQAFPQIAQAAEQRLVEIGNSRLTVEGTREYDSIQETIRNTTDPAELIIARGRLEATRSRFGGQSAYEQTSNLLASRLQPLAREQAMLNRAVRVMEGDTTIPYDESDMQRALPILMQRNGINPMQRPEDAAQLVLRARTIPPDLKSQMSSALIDYANPQGQMAALRFYRTLEEANRGTGEGFVLGNMSDEARDVYRMARALELTGGDPAQMFQQLRENQTALRDRNATNWQQLTQARDARTAETAVRGWINSELGNTLGSGGRMWGMGDVEPPVDPNLRRRIEDLAMYNVVRRQRAGFSNVEEAVRATVRDAVAAGRIEMVPVANGEVSLRLREGPTHDAQGRPIVTPGIAVLNPATGRTEDTNRTFRNDVTRLQRRIPELIPNATLVGVEGNHMLAGTGAYFVQSNGRTVAFAPGTTITIGGDAVQLPRDIAQARDVLMQRFADEPRFQIVTIPGVGLVLGYRFGFTETRPTVDQQEQRVNQENTQRQERIGPAGEASRGVLQRTEQLRRNYGGDAPATPPSRAPTAEGIPPPARSRRDAERGGGGPTGRAIGGSLTGGLGM